MLYKNIFIIIIVAASLSGCAGYATRTKQDVRSSHHVEETDIYKDVRGGNELRSRNYLDANITKDEVIKAWGAPDEILKIKYEHDSLNNKYNSDHYERWIYNRDISWGAFTPIIIIPIPIFWWPNGYLETQLDFYSENYLHSVSKEHDGPGPMYICYLIPPSCNDKLEFFH